MPSIEITVILPMFNEVDWIERCVHEVEVALERFSSSYEIIIAEDGSTEGTDKIAAWLASQDERIAHLHSDERMGKGAALKRGIKCARGDVIAFIDADLATSLDYLQALIDTAKESSGMSIGSRLVDGAVVERPVLRGVVSRFYNFIVRALFRDGVRDHQCGFKAFNESLLNNINAADNGWFWDTEMIVRAEKAGYKIIEIPIKWTEKRRPQGSKIKVFRDAKTLGLALLRFWWKMRMGGGLD